MKRWQARTDKAYRLWINGLIATVSFFEEIPV